MVGPESDPLGSGAVTVPDVSGGDSERFWDERARENALYFVDTGVGYQDPDTDAFWRRGQDVVQRMLDLADVAIRECDAIVDIGCGVGRLTRALAARAGHVYGLDVSREMLALARRHNADLCNVEWLHGDGHGLQALGDATVDGCFSHVVFQHIPEPEVTLDYVRDMGRVLRDGGWALFQVSTDPGVHRVREGLRVRMQRLVGAESRVRHDRAWWGSAVEVGALHAAVEQGGLELKQLHGAGSQYTTVFARRAQRVR